MTTGVNVPLLEKVMTHILDYPETHDQFLWMSQCGTRACFAGWAVLLDESNEYTQGENPTCYYDSQGNELAIWEVARRLLCLSEDEASILFFSLNTRDDLENYVKQLKNGETLMPNLGVKRAFPPG